MRTWPWWCPSSSPCIHDQNVLPFVNQCNSLLRDVILWNPMKISMLLIRYISSWAHVRVNGDIRVHGYVLVHMQTFLLLYVALAFAFILLSHPESYCQVYTTSFVELYKATPDLIGLGLSTIIYHIWMICGLVPSYTGSECLVGLYHHILDLSDFVDCSVRWQSWMTTGVCAIIWQGWMTLVDHGITRCESLEDCTIIRQMWITLEDCTIIHQMWSPLGDHSQVKGPQ